MPRAFLRSSHGPDYVCVPFSFFFSFSFFALFLLRGIVGGDSIFTYAIPSEGMGAHRLAAPAPMISGKVSKTKGSSEWIVEDALGNKDTSFGPVNFVLAGQ